MALTIGVVAVVAIETRLATLAFALAGLPPLAAIVMLLASLAGSAVDIPVGHTTAPPALAEVQPVRQWGIVFFIPRPAPHPTVIAVNVGGALIPVGVSVYLLARGHLWIAGLGAAALTAIVVHAVARPVPGVGITVPTWVPAVASALTALLWSPSGNAAAVAYVAGVLGTLVGADLTHLKRITSLGGDRVSIGGAGTFDGVFLSGILAVLLAAVM